MGRIYTLTARHERNETTLEDFTVRHGHLRFIQI